MIDPFAQVVEPTMLDCSDPDCTGIHDLGQLPDESRAEWIARLRAMVAADPRYDYVPGQHSQTTVICNGCGRERARGFTCSYCDLRAPTLVRRPA